MDAGLGEHPGADQVGSPADARGAEDTGEAASHARECTESARSQGTNSHSAPDLMTVHLSDPRVLRATGASALLSGLGRHFRKGTGLALATFTEEEAARLWSKSWQAERIDNFVSHCWSDAGISKAAALLWYCNSAAAAVAAVAAGLVCAVFSSVGWLPSFLQEDTYVVRGVARYAPWSLCVGNLVFFGTLAFGHRITDSRLWHHIARRQTFFFDKLCVHQSNAEPNNAGIRSIAAIVARSQRMVMLWSPLYFTRLWCTLECASLIHIAEGHVHKQGRLPLTFYPIAIASNATMLAIVTFGGAVFFNFSKAIALQYSVEETPMIVNTIMAAALGVGSLVYMHSLRWYMRQRLLLNSQLEGFSISRTGCSIDADRVLICETIRQWFGSLDAFSHVVQTQVREHVIQAIGSEVHVSYDVLLGTVPLICAELDYIPMSIGVGGWQGFMLVLSIPTYILLLMAQIQLIHRVARCVARQRHLWAADAAVSFAMAFLWTCATVGQLVLLDLTSYIPMGSVFWFFSKASILVLYVALTAILALMK